MCIRKVYKARKRRVNQATRAQYFNRLKDRKESRELQDSSKSKRQAGTKA